MRETCCDCKHFRMWKPAAKYCTVTKTVVNPLAKGCQEYERRKNLPGDKVTREYYQLIKVLGLPLPATVHSPTIIEKCDICGKKMTELEKKRVLVCDHGKWVRLLHLVYRAGRWEEIFESSPFDSLWKPWKERLIKRRKSAE